MNSTQQAKVNSTQQAEVNSTQQAKVNSTQQAKVNSTQQAKVNSTQQAKVQLKGKDIEEDNKFTYLGSVGTDKGGTDEDIKNRIGKARHAFSILKTVWNTSSFSARSDFSTPT